LSSIVTNAQRSDVLKWVKCTMKKRTNGSSDLRTNPISLTLHKYSQLNSLKDQARSDWGITHLQPFFPAIESLFKTNELSFVNEYGIKFKNEITSILPEHVKCIGSNELNEVHLKKRMILSPYKYMQGECGTLGLPVNSDQASEIHERLQSHNNAAYVGAIVSSVLSESGCEHFPKIYGVFSGIADKHSIDISDEYEDLSEKAWFSQNIGKTFDLSLKQSMDMSPEFSHTRSSRVTLQLGEDAMLDGVEELVTPSDNSSVMGDLKQVMEDMVEEDSDDSDSVSTSYIFAINSCKCDEDDKEIMDYEDDESDDEPFAWASFSNVPIQVTVMEKCEGTLFELMKQNDVKEKHLAWLSQVTFALAYAQRNFGFVHNDLHSNNVMYVKTEKEHLYYNFSGVTYRVPTFGYVIKLIDFERAVCSIKLVGMKEAKFFMSDHFSVNDEAGGQYNYSPFYIPKYPEIKPNPSFDLVRLATSLFWDFYPEGPNHIEYDTDPVFRRLKKWLTIDDGSSILFGKEDPRHDRYHGFTLYKAIARYCRDTAVPKKEIVSLQPFYAVTTVPAGESVLVIDS
jgi:hypothetical protein